MTDDPASIPRRLRRFYRKGEPIPEDGMGDSSYPKNEPSSFSSNSENEPWMNPPIKEGSQSPSNARRNRRMEKEKTPESMISPPRFEKVLEETQKPSITPMDHALGLSGKSVFEQRMPAQSQQAISSNDGKRAEIEHTLQELKDLASSGKEKDEKAGVVSFHFTPVGGAPAIPSAETKPIEGNYPSLTTNPSQLSPRERMEMRRQREGTATAPIPEKEGQFPEDNSSSPHFRRRMGQMVSPGDEMRERTSPTPTIDRNNPSKEELGSDFKELFEDPTKKKKPIKSKDGEDDLSLDEDMPLFEDEK